MKTGKLRAIGASSMLVLPKFHRLAGVAFSLEQYQETHVTHNHSFFLALWRLIADHRPLDIFISVNCTTHHAALRQTP
jgi:hypothetical protein